MNDLDARVAALMALADKHASSGMQITADQYVNRKDPTKARCDHLADYEALESALRTALQKPALHEPCTLEEAARVMAHLHYQGNPDLTMKSVRFAVNSVLQGRAQPAQEFYCNKCGYFGPNQTHPSCGYLGVPVTQTAQPAQEEITEADLDAWKCERCNGDGWYWESVQVAERESDRQEVKMDCRECDGTGYMGPDAIRASKGEKT